MENQGIRNSLTKESIRELHILFSDITDAFKNATARGSNLVRICEQRGLNYKTIIDMIRSYDFKQIRTNGYVSISMIRTPREPYEILMGDILSTDDELHGIPFDSYESTVYVLKNMLPELDAYIASLRIGLVTKPMKFKEISEILIDVGIDARITPTSVKYNYLNSIINLRANGHAMRILKYGLVMYRKDMEYLRQVQENERTLRIRKEMALILQIVKKAKSIKVQKRLDNYQLLASLRKLGIKNYFDLMFFDTTDAKGIGKLFSKVIEDDLNQFLSEFGVDLKYIRERYAKDMFFK